MVKQKIALKKQDLAPLPEGWQAIQVKDAATRLKPGKLFDDKSVSSKGSVPVVNQSKESLHGYHDEDPGVEASPERPVTTFANHTCNMRLLTEPFSCIQNVFPRIGKEGVCDTKFLYYVTLARIKQAGYKGHEPYYRDQWIPLPPIEEQRKIGDTLFSYDALIENNHRRVQLLEEAARLLYREWFVHLRFPGHEHVKIVDGVPEGWERKPLGEITELHYGKALKQQDRVEGSAPVYGSSGEVGTHEKGLVAGPGIVVGRKGTVGSVYWVDTEFWPIDTVYYVEPNDVSFSLFYALLNTPFVSSDAAVPGLNRKFAYSRPVLWPSGYLRDQFEEYVADISAQISNLKRQNKKLAEARDLLLPRLMNGEIAV